MKLVPEDQFAHSLEIVARLGEQYGIDVVEYKEATSGIENTTLIITGTQGTYVFRIYRQAKKTDSQINAEINFMAYLGANHVPVPSIIQNTHGQLITRFESATRLWQVIVMEFINGQHPEVMSAELLADVAATQARMHTLAAEYVVAANPTRKLTELVETEFITQINLADVAPELRAFLERGAAYKVTIDIELPIGLCHLDYDAQNMLCEGDAVTAVLDFDDMATAPYVLCLAYTLWHVQDEYGAAVKDTYLKHYEYVRSLNDRERQFLPAAMLFRHYMISALKVLYGKDSPEHIQSYLQVEDSLHSLANHTSSL